TAAVLLLDFSSGELIATAAAGLEEEVRQGVRIPVGRGFAGRIAAGHQPVILDHVDHGTVLNPILWAKGIRTLMGVPLIAGRKMQHFEPGALATVAYAVFAPGLDRVHICSAGHHPPVIAAAGQPAELADVPSGLLIGAAPGARRRVATIDISPGTLMCFYTDG